MAVHERDQKAEKRLTQRPAAGAVEPAIRAIVQFHRTGRKSIASDGNRMPYSNAPEAAKAAGLSPEMLRKARSFAREYSQRDLQVLCGLCRKHRAIIGITHAIRLVTVPRDERGPLERQAIEGHWSCRQLDAEIRRRFGSRRTRAGRLPHSPENASRARYDVMRLAQQWLRFCDSISTRDAVALTRSEREALAQARPAIGRVLQIMQSQLVLHRYSTDG